MKKRNKTPNKKTKDTFIFRTQWWHDLKPLQTEDREKMMDCIVDYAEHGIVPNLSGFELIVFNNIKASIDKSGANYYGVVEEDARRRMNNKKIKLSCEGCSKCSDCKKKDSFYRTGKCDEMDSVKGADERIGNCKSCALMSACKAKYKYVKNTRLTKRCSKFCESSNIYDNDSDICDDSIDVISTTKVVKNNNLLPSSTTKEEERKDSPNFSCAYDVDGGGGSSVSRKEKIIKRLEGRGVDARWASCVYDDLEAQGFKSGNKDITDIIGFMHSRWEKRMAYLERQQAQQENEKLEMKEELKEKGGGAPPPSEESVRRFDEIFESLDGTDEYKFREAFRLVGESEEEVVLQLPAKATYDVYTKRTKCRLLDMVQQSFGKKVTIVFKN